MKMVQTSLIGMVFLFASAVVAGAGWSTGVWLIGKVLKS